MPIDTIKTFLPRRKVNIFSAASDARKQAAAQAPGRLQAIAGAKAFGKAKSGVFGLTDSARTAAGKAKAAAHASTVRERTAAGAAAGAAAKGKAAAAARAKAAAQAPGRLQAIAGAKAFGKAKVDAREKETQPAIGLGKFQVAKQQPFDIGSTQLFQQSQQATEQQLAGETPGFDTQANIAREAQKAAQAQRAKSIREGLLSQGFSDTGKFLKEGLIAPEQQEFRESQDLERQLVSDKAIQSQQQVAAGQQGASNLLGLLGQQETTKTQLASQEKQQLTGIDATKDLTVLEDTLLSGQKIGDQDFQTSMTNLDAQIAEAQSEQNFGQTKHLQDLKNKFQLQVQTQDMDHDEKMLFLSNEYQSARDDADFEKAKNLKSFEHDLQMAKITGAQEFEEKMSYLDNAFNKALQDNDFQNQQVLEAKKYQVEMQKHQDLLALSKAELALEEAGVQLQIDQVEYNNIKEEIAAGNLDPDAAIEYLKDNMDDETADILDNNQPNPQAVQKALDEDFLNQQYQYALISGDLDGDGFLDAAIYNDDGNFTGLTEDEGEQFHEHLLKTFYEESGGTPLQADIVAIKVGDIPIDQIEERHIEYLKNDISVPKVKNLSYSSFTEGEDGKGRKSRTTYRELEEADFVVANGVLWKIVSMNQHTRVGDDWSKYNLLNVETGATKTITAKER